MTMDVHFVSHAGVKRQLLFMGALLLGVNFVLFAWLAKRLDGIESSQSALASLQKRDRLPIASTQASNEWFRESQAQRRTSTATIGTTPGHNAIQQFKSIKSSVPVEQRIRQMDALLANEPKDPKRERLHQGWLEQAATELTGGKIPVAQDLFTACQGRRCVVNATFANEGEADRWATRYLLAAGGKYLSGSRSVISPTSDGSATLQLYLF